MDMPQNNKCLKMMDLFIVFGSAARHNAPSVESGLTSTKCEPRLTATTISAKLLLPILSISSGNSGMNVGITTPDELLYIEMRPAVKASMPLTVWADE